MIWREKRLVLIVLGVLLAANTIFFFTYRVQYESRLDALDARMDTVKAQLEEARRARMSAEQQVAAYRKIERDVQDVIGNRWATQGERLTLLITEIKRLAAKSTLVPPSYSFDQGEAKSGTTGSGTGTGANQKIGAKEVGIRFTVEGTYQQIRRLINMLELSHQFVIIDQIGLSTTSGETLTMNIHVKTLFHDPSEAAPRRGGNQDL